MRSWGGLPERAQASLRPAWRDDILRHWRGQTLPVGLGRSYGDVGLAAAGTVLSIASLDRLLAYDREAGLIRCEAGVTLGQIMELTVPDGWMPPVLPGTQHVTVGGALANDIHGKNHHRVGSFARHVRALGLLRSSGELLHCSPGENRGWFAASLGGLGLTGVVVWAELRLRRVAGPWLASETIAFRSLADFFALSRDSEPSHEYTVAWLDCLSAGARGLFSRANHLEDARPAPVRRRLSGLPLVPPSCLLTPAARLFNRLYFRLGQRSATARRVSWRRWFFPLDGIANWNRLYGKAGFRQYQCVVPDAVAAELLALVRRAGQGSFLAVLKQFGACGSPALLSFPRPGTTLALDFPWRGARTTKLFRELDEVVFSNGGALYPAKDAHMRAADFQRAYPRWRRLESLRDPNILSLFWQRVSR